MPRRTYPLPSIHFALARLNRLARRDADAPFPTRRTDRASPQHSEEGISNALLALATQMKHRSSLDFRSRMCFTPQMTTRLQLTRISGIMFLKYVSLHSFRPDCCA